MTRFALTVEYDGRPFMGWQRQAHGPSVQQAIEDAAATITGETVTCHAAGRTDAGVHALGMRAPVEIAKPIEPFRLMEALNARLRPAPVAVLACETVPDDWQCAERKVVKSCRPTSSCGASCIAPASSGCGTCHANPFSTVNGARRLAMRYS